MTQVMPFEGVGARPAHLRDHRFGHVRDLNGTFRCTSKRYLNGPLRRRWVVASIFTFT